MTCTTEAEVPHFAAIQGCIQASEPLLGKSLSPDKQQ